jgi:diguanylate cyclase (GGDEF)-like protein
LILPWQEANMTQRIFVVGKDHERRAEIQNVLQGRFADVIVTASEKPLQPVKEADTILIACDEKDAEIVCQQIRENVEEQRRRAELFRQLIQLFSSPLPTGRLLRQAVSKSSALMGDTAFIVLSSDAKRLQVQTAFSRDRSRARDILTTIGRLQNESIAQNLISQVFTNKESVFIEQLQVAVMSRKAKAFVKKHALQSLLAIPIQGEQKVLGAFVSLTTGSRTLKRDDLSIASSLVHFIAIALQKAETVTELQRAAATDSLTGAYNMVFFRKVLAEEAARANRYKTPLSLLIIDIDGFKRVNDTFGYGAGDKVLGWVSKSLHDVVRKCDFVCRYGGDKFAIVLPGTNVTGGMRVAEKTLQKVNSFEILQSLGYSGAVTVSIGVSEHVPPNPFKTVVSEAEAALRDCKSSSKNCAKVYQT